MVQNRELAAGEIAAGFEVTRPAISQHLTVLKNAGLVTERREGTRRLYRARPEGLAELRAFLDGFWADRLERLKLAAEQEQRVGRVGRAAKRN
jgi:DNA-binding transcriptional ArsR family regulator